MVPGQLPPAGKPAVETHPQHLILLLWVIYPHFPVIPGKCAQGFYNQGTLRNTPIHWLPHLGPLLSHNASTKANSPNTGSAVKGTEVGSSVPYKKQRRLDGSKASGQHEGRTVEIMLEYLIPGSPVLYLCHCDGAVMCGLAVQ